MSQAIDDCGTVFRRGRRTTVTSDVAELLLRSDPMADSFVFLPPGEDEQ
ncbi:MAG TPA: hypothetical protein VGI81_27040 [Tepidisphaeraceae bacterium]|jgi:hypothetical protein